MLDRIDEIATPGVNINPADGGWVSPAVQAHLAIQEADDSGSLVTWGEHVTDKEYRAAPVL